MNKFKFKKTKEIKEEQINIKNKKISLSFLVFYFITSFVFFTYTAIYKLNTYFIGKSVFASYYLLQFQFIKNIKIWLLSFAVLSLIFLGIYIKTYIKNGSFKKLFIFYLAIIFISILGFNFAYLGMRAFALGDVFIERIKINKNHKAENVYWDTNEIVDKLKNQNEPPKIVKGEDNTTKQIILIVLNTKNRDSFYKQQVLSATLNFFSPKIIALGDPAFVIAESNLVIKKFDIDALETITPTLAKLMVEKETDQRYIKNNPGMHLMGREEYNKFREDQINEAIAEIDAKLVKVNNAVKAFSSAVAYDKGQINYNIGMANSMISQGVTAYISCKNQTTCIRYYSPRTCYIYGVYTNYSYECGSWQCDWQPLYTESYCSSQRDFYYNLADDYTGRANGWQPQLQSDQYDIPFELGLFEPPNNIKIAVDSTKIETLADYFETSVHEYFHYTSYVSEESSLPTFFEEGLTEYFARKAIKDSMGIETYEGYPLIVKVIGRMMEKIPEKDFQDIYFTKSANLLASTLDNAFGKDFSKNNELYFEFIKYIPQKDALDITNKMLDKIGVQKLTEDDLFSKSSEF
ncbi:MAG: hypothetical protein NTZ97_01300 [Candidatus Moranbacteria bacterium]|nr:hypothetical protein [Candidatus Moranbacteria bacterium]